jgi:hypothetical protein
VLADDVLRPVLRAEYFVMNGICNVCERSENTECGNSDEHLSLLILQAVDSNKWEPRSALIIWINDGQCSPVDTGKKLNDDFRPNDTVLIDWVKVVVRPTNREKALHQRNLRDLSGRWRNYWSELRLPRRRLF